MPSNKTSTVLSETSLALLFNNHRGEALGVLHIDGLNVAVQLLLGVLLVVSSSGNADTESERNALDTLLPDLLVELGVQADIGGALKQLVSIWCNMQQNPSQSIEQERGLCLTVCQLPLFLRRSLSLGW